MHRASRAAKLLTCVVIIYLIATLLPLFAACSDTNAGTQSRRDREMQPERVMDAIGIRPGMVVGEPGAGTGYFTFWMSARVGNEGLIYANDINERSLERLRQRCKDENVTNIIAVLGKTTDPLFPEATMEKVVFVQAFHDFTQPVEFLRNLKSSLKPGAEVVIIDIDPEVTGESSHFLTKAEVRERFAEAGYRYVREEDFLERYLILIFVAEE